MVAVVADQSPALPFVVVLDSPLIKSNLKLNFFLSRIFALSKSPQNHIVLPLKLRYGVEKREGVE